MTQFKENLTVAKNQYKTKRHLSNGGLINLKKPTPIQLICLKNTTKPSNNIQLTDLT